MIRRPPRSTLFPTRRSSDLINIIMLSHFPMDLFTFLRLLFLPSLIVIAINIGIFFLLYRRELQDRKSTRLNSSHTVISYAVFCLKKKKIDKSTGLSIRDSE